MSRKRPDLFNTPFELGLRMVYLLFALRPGGADLQKLVLLDYAIVYSEDVGGLPAFTLLCLTVTQSYLAGESGSSKVST